MRAKELDAAYDHLAVCVVRPFSDEFVRAVIATPQLSVGSVSPEAFWDVYESGQAPNRLYGAEINDEGDAI